MSTSSVSPLSNALTSLAPQTSTTGSSTFASDLQASVTRAIDIASLPLQALQADQSTISGKTSELSTLGSLVGSLQTALQSISSGTGSSALQATVADKSVLSANVTGSALAGTYNVQVFAAGAPSSATSTGGTTVTDPTTQNISSSGSFTLTVGTSTYTITPSAQNLNALATSINSSGAPVQAVVVNFGSPSSPDYRLALQSTALGNVPLQLNDGNANLLGGLTAGANASYSVDGSASIASDSSTVTIAPGLNVTLEAAGTSNVTVSSSLSSVSSELSSFVTAYNAAFTELQKNEGQGGGTLTGDSTVLEVQQALTQMITYSGSGGSITSLAQLGVEFTQQGTLTFNSSALASLSQTQIGDALSFLGDTSTGGFLQYANNTLNTITDPVSGSVATETQTLSNQNQSDQTHINTDQAQLTLLQTNLQNQMAQANALISTLQNQASLLQNLFQYNTSNNPYASNG